MFTYAYNVFFFFFLLVCVKKKSLEKKKKKKDQITSTVMPLLQSHNKVCISHGLNLRLVEINIMIC